MKKPNPGQVIATGSHLIPVAPLFALYVLLLAMAQGPPAYAGSSIPLSISTAYLQTFDTLGTNAPATLPTGFRVDQQAAVRTVGSFGAAGTATAVVGAANLTGSAATGIYNYGAGTNGVGGADRAVGFLSGGSGSGILSGNLYAQFRNLTGITLAGLLISYDVEKYRKGSNAAGFSIQLYYSFDGTNWSNAGTNFLTSFPADTSNNGYATVPGATVSVAGQVLNVAITNGANFYLAWNYSVTSGTTASSAQGLGIDNVSVLGSRLLFVNEWLASNVNTITNPATGQPDPWVKLYNGGQIPQDLSGCYLSANLTNPAQFRIPSGSVIQAQGFLTFWANGGSGDGGTGGFLLTTNAGMLGLYAPDFTRIDETFFGPQFDDLSQGRWPDGAWASYFLTHPTFGLSNGSQPLARNYSALFSDVYDFQVINVITNSDSAETNQNTEANIAADQAGTPSRYILLSAFNSGAPPGCPYYSTALGRDRLSQISAWKKDFSISHRDTSVACGNTFWRAILTDDNKTIPTWTSEAQYLSGFGGFPWPDEVSGTFTPESGSDLSAVGDNYVPDQPWIEAVGTGGGDFVYMALNQMVHFPRTATIVVSTVGLGGPRTWSATTIEQEDPSQGQDGPSVRVAVGAGLSNPADRTKVYGLFERWKSQNNWGDYVGDLVLVRDDNYGQNGFSALGHGTIVATNVAFPGATPLGLQRAPSGCSLAVDPNDARNVFVAYTEAALDGTSGLPSVHLRVRRSADSGASFGANVFTPADPAALPALAVAANGTVGLLYTSLKANYLDTHFVQFPFQQYAVPYQALSGPQFGQPQDFVLSSFRNGSPPIPFNCVDASSSRVACQPYIGDYEDLVAVENMFYGAFSASGEPDPTHFPSGVLFHRFVKDPNSVWSDATLTLKGNLVSDSSGNTQVPFSMDPYYFQQPAGTLPPTKVDVKPPPGYTCVQLGPPANRVVCYPITMTWPTSAPRTAQWRLEATDALGAQAIWAPVQEPAVEILGGQFQTAVQPNAQQKYFRLRLDSSNTGPFGITSAAGAHGQIFPLGWTNANAGQSRSFTAFPDASYFVSKWYLDGAVAQIQGNSFALTNISRDHAVTVCFAPANDLVVSKVAQPWSPDQEEDQAHVGTNLTYTITVANQGINPSTGVQLTDALPASLVLLSTANSTGSLVVASNVVTWAIGTLTNGASATASLVVVPTASGWLTNTATVTGNEFETDLTNNVSTIVTGVVSP